VQGDFRRAVETDRNDTRARTGGRVADHVVIFEAAPPHETRQDAVERDRYAARETELAAMGVAGEQDVEVGMRRQPEDLRRMGQENRELVVRNSLCGLLDIVHAIEVGVVDAGKMNAGAPALDRFGLVQQHTDAHLLEQRHHANRNRDCRARRRWVL